MAESHHTFRNGEDFLSQEELEHRILRSPAGIGEITPSVRKIDLLSFCHNHGLISDRQLVDSTPIRHSTLKCYLSEIVSCYEDFDRVQEYVKVQSQLFIRSTRIQNLAAHLILGIPLGFRAVYNRVCYLWYIPPRPEETLSYELYQILFSRQSKLKFLKQCYLPEKYGDDVHLHIKGCLDSLGPDLTPPNWLGIMSRKGWHNVVNDHATSMQANIKTMIKAKILPLAKRYVLKLQWNIPPAALENLLIKPWPGAENIPPEFRTDTVEVIHNIRKACKIKDNEYFNSVETLTPTVFDLYIHFVRYGIQNREILPLASFGRKYSYIDDSIAKELFGKTRINNKRNIDDVDSSAPVANVFNSVFTLSRDGFNQRRKNTRTLRRSWKQKGKQCGYKVLPVWANIKSLSTDGIGVSLTMSKPYGIPRTPRRIFKFEPSLTPSQWKRQRFQQMRMTDTSRPVFVGVDTGRAKLYMASVEQPGDQGPRSICFTRGSYYWEIGHHKRKAFERQRREQNPLLVEAYAALSEAGKLYDLRERLAVETQYRDILVDDSIISIDRAIWRMRAHRWKTSSLDRAADRLIRAAQPSVRNQRIIIGLGSGGFPSGGRGEKSVPVKGIEQAIYRARDRQARTFINRGRTHSIDVFRVDEFRTTCRCCRCGAQTIRAPPPYSRSQYPSSRLRLCRNCDQHVGKLIDRDVNGARNILKCIINEYWGLPRPQYLRRPNQGQAEVRFENSV